ncbi:hypothetical protein CONPUDRAFT_150919 [Coniophora puteana RWD-64-598 SS2]|uniref:Uncharacterized protein n=1 Tax=Coniophora puteana (strain RWD-64-598) TaxID=741705 RepID=A0A5M3MXN9_CONPW|nr:uncharacterized protein CONPUDRAFT_150919 [Coniophora puteana RWD-64-598 SS2]EIW83870.1 hypothetical protein CONPUDRAFT_150919 [Coniophora puteana RWD-64-598 SS2]
MEPNGLSLDKAAILSGALESILYGFSLLLFGITLWVLFRKDNPKWIFAYKLGVACAFMGLSTAFRIVDMIRHIEGLVNQHDTYPGGPNAFFADRGQWTFAVKNILYLCQTLVGDSVVIFRCYVAWQSWKVVALPIVLWFGVAVAGTGCIHTLMTDNTSKDNIFAPETGAWITPFIVSSLVCNLFSTTLLVYRLWSIGRQTTRLTRQNSPGFRPHSRTGHLVRIFADAGLLYSFTLLCLLVTFVTQNRGMYVVLAIIMPIISITFYMVIIRIETRTEIVTVGQSIRGFFGNEVASLPVSVGHRRGGSECEEDPWKQEFAGRPPYSIQMLQDFRKEYCAESR